MPGAVCRSCESATHTAAAFACAVIRWRTGRASTPPARCAIRHPGRGPSKEGRRRSAGAHRRVEPLRRRRRHTHSRCAGIAMPAEPDCDGKSDRPASPRGPRSPQLPEFPRYFLRYGAAQRGDHLNVHQLGGHQERVVQQRGYLKPCRCPEQVFDRDRGVDDVTCHSGSASRSRRSSSRSEAAETPESVRGRVASRAFHSCLATSRSRAASTTSLMVRRCSLAQRRSRS